MYFLNIAALIRGLLHARSQLKTSLSDRSVTLFNFHTTDFAEKLVNVSFEIVYSMSSRHHSLAAVYTLSLEITDLYPLPLILLTFNHFIPHFSDIELVAWNQISLLSTREVTACVGDHLGQTLAMLTSGLQGTTVAKPAKLRKGGNYAGVCSTSEDRPSNHPSK
ncbi:unnamed protein product [Angiostrongylus costaricensis]|uniref:HORMA domain-containing protein n=1 Tax=Angiostrongylus costaricensis TaxID=334426 RepID=A0A0R3PTY3_ANGCS|nr:unnamed protein product [Angiostrongylus costaricensis]